MEGTTLTLAVPNFYYVDQVKREIHRMKGIPHYKQKVIFLDKVLDGRLTLADYDITHETTLQLVVRDDASSSDDEPTSDQGKCIACGGPSRFNLVTPGCRNCIVQQSRELIGFK